MNTKTFCMHPCLRTAQFTSAAVATIALAMCTIPAKPAHGTPISFAALEWKLAAKEQVLIDAHDMMAIKGAMWDVPAQRRLERNMPWLEIHNDSNSDANLTQFRMTIGDERFNFSSEMYPNYAVVSPSSDFLDVTFSSPNNPAAMDMDYAGLSEGDVLVVDFGGAGLPPGALARIRFDLGIDVDHPELAAIWPHPDFRTVLFDMNGIDAWGPNPQTPRPPMTDDNAMVVGVFEKDGMVAVSPSTAFPDATVVGPQSQIFNQFFRSAKVMEGVDVFDVVAVIPEPSSMLLAMVGTMGFGLVSQRRMVAGRRDDTSTTATYRHRNNPRPRRQLACRHRLARRAARSVQDVQLGEPTDMASARGNKHISRLAGGTHQRTKPPTRDTQPLVVAWGARNRFTSVS